MDSNAKFPILAHAMVLLLILSPTACRTQQVLPGMESYLKPADAGWGGITNIYSAAVVAYQTIDECSGDPPRQQTFRSDAAWTLSGPLLKPGKTIRLGQDRPGCIRVDAAIFADGLELGDKAVLRQMHDCRSAQWDEFHRLLDDDIQRVPLQDWDPGVSIAKLKMRRVPLDRILYSDDPSEGNIYSCRHQGIDSLIRDIQDYQTSVASNPDKFGPRKYLFLRYLMGIESALASSAYPAERAWWKGP